MKQLAAELKSSYAFVERHFNLAKRYFGWELVFLVYTIVNSLTICFIGYTQGKEKVLYLVVGAMLWGFLSILFHEISESVSWERWEGTIEYTFMAPIHRFTHLAGMCFYSIIYGIIRTSLLLLAVAVFFSLSLKDANLPAALVILVVSSLSFIGLGLMAAVLPLMSPEKGSQATHIFQAVLLLISGVYYETSILPAWIRPLSVASPATYTLRTMRAALLEGRPLAEMQNTLLLLLAIGLVLIPLGLLIFHQAEIYAKKSGKLKRSG